MTLIKISTASCFRMSTALNAIPTSISNLEFARSIIHSADRFTPMDLANLAILAMS
jgi:hypothetical protein